MEGAGVMVGVVVTFIKDLMAHPTSTERWTALTIHVADSIEEGAALLEGGEDLNLYCHLSLVKI